MCFTRPYRLIWQVVPPLTDLSLHLFLSPNKKFLGRGEFQFLEIHCFNSVIVPGRSISLLQCLIPAKGVKTLVGDTACLAVPNVPLLGPLTCLSPRPAVHLCALISSVWTWSSLHVSSGSLTAGSSLSTVWDHGLIAYTFFSAPFLPLKPNH